MVLAALALRIGETVSADVLIDTLLGERPPPTASKALSGQYQRTPQATCRSEWWSHRDDGGWLPVGHTKRGARPCSLRTTMGARGVSCSSRTRAPGGRCVS